MIWITCPKCGGKGQYRFLERVLSCGVCAGAGQLAVPEPIPSPGRHELAARDRSKRDEDVMVKLAQWKMLQAFSEGDPGDEQTT